MSPNCSANAGIRSPMRPSEPGSATSPRWSVHDCVPAAAAGQAAPGTSMSVTSTARSTGMGTFWTRCSVSSGTGQRHVASSGDWPKSRCARRCASRRTSIGVREGHPLDPGTEGVASAEPIPEQPDRAGSAGHQAAVPPDAGLWVHGVSNPLLFGVRGAVSVLTSPPQSWCARAVVGETAGLPGSVAGFDRGGRSSLISPGRDRGDHLCGRRRPEIYRTEQRVAKGVRRARGYRAVAAGVGASAGGGSSVMLASTNSGMSACEP